MTDQEFGSNPWAIPGAERPRTGWYDVNGCRLYAEVRGQGPPILIIGAASDDAEMFRPIAERLTGFTVVTYDRRGTLRSGRDGWPCGSAQHADDAAALFGELGLGEAHVFGASAGGIVAVTLALRHSDLVRRVLVFEPGFFLLSEPGRRLVARAGSDAVRHLHAHPGDWAGAMAVATARPSDETPRGILEPPPGLEWYSARADDLAENFIRDDLPLTREPVDLKALAGCEADLRFAYGSESHPIFREIAERLSEARRRPQPAGRVRPEAVQGAGHVAYYTPGIIADYIRRECS